LRGSVQLSNDRNVAAKKDSVPTPTYRLTSPHGVVVGLRRVDFVKEEASLAAAMLCFDVPGDNGDVTVAIGSVS